MRTKRFLCFIMLFITVTNLLPITSYATENWLWPIENYYNISSGYGYRTWNDSWHSGIDIDEIGPGNILGKPVRATKSGYATVSWGYNGGNGNNVSIDHGDGYVSKYLHLNSIAIGSGNVTRGQIIGYVGNTGNSYGEHLHFGINYKGSEVNPMPVNYDGRHTYIGSSAAFSENIRYDYDVSSTHAFRIEYEAAHPHKEYRRCSCGYTEYTGGFRNNYGWGVEAVHPHKEYKKCNLCDYYEYTGILIHNDNCGYCVQPSAPIVTEEDPVYSFKNNTVTLSWDSVPYAEKYLYYLGEHPTGYTYNTPIKSGTTTNPYITFSELPVGKYAFFVHAENGGGRSPQSNWVSIVVNDKDYVPVATEVYNDHIYALYDSWTSWSYAKELCEKMGGHLVTITSKEENDFIKSFIDKGQRSGYWIGLSDENQDAYDFKWINGERFGFTDWAVGDPNNWGEYGNREDYVQIHKNYNYNWIDTANRTGTTAGVILEIELKDILPTAEKIYNGKKYLLFDHNMTWTEARAYCESIGGCLATINSSGEYEFLSEFIESGNRSWYFLGAIKKDGVFRWIDNSGNVPISGGNSHWLDGTPTSDFYSNYMMMYKGSKKWYELKNLYEYSDHMKHLGFICELNSPEIELSPSVNFLNKRILNVILKNIETGSEVLVAEYSNGKRLLEFDKAVWEGYEMQFDIDDGTGYVKVMAWNGLEDAIPLCESIVVSGIEFVR